MLKTTGFFEFSMPKYHSICTGFCLSFQGLFPWYSKDSALFYAQYMVGILVDDIFPHQRNAQNLKI